MIDYQNIMRTIHGGSNRSVMAAGRPVSLSASIYFSFVTGNFSPAIIGVYYRLSFFLRLLSRKLFLKKKNCNIAPVN